MKSWISKALLGLCLFAPSAMALLPMSPGKYAGIHMDVSGFSSTQRTAFNNGMGLWLLGMRSTFTSNTTKFRFVTDPAAPNTVASVSIQKVNAPTSNCATGVDPRRCAFDISYSYNGNPTTSGLTYDNVAITVYTKNAQGLPIDLPLGNSTDDQISFQNFASYLIMLVLDGSLEPADFFNEFETNEGARRVIVPYGCSMEYNYNNHNAGALCGGSMGNPYYKDNLLPILSFTKLDNAGNIVGRIAVRHKLGMVEEYGAPGWILTSARYALSSTPAGGKSVKYGTGGGGIIGNTLVVGANSGTDAPCFNLGGSYFQGYSTSYPPTGPIGIAANAGLNINNITRISTSVGDAISGTYPQSCQTTIGFVADFLQGS